MSEQATQTMQPAHIPNKFVFAEGVERGLNISHNTNQNIILWGQGGHGKSEIALKFFRDKGIAPYVKSLGKGTTIDSLMGGIDLNVFQHGIIDEEATKLERERTGDSTIVVYSRKPGAIEYMVENSFMNHEYVIFEELLDCESFVLETLKDILTSGYFRNGTQVYKVKTKQIVCCTNRERQEFINSDASLKALMERFPLEVHVAWPAYTSTNYDKMFKECFKKKNSMISSILGEMHTNGVTISPRTAVKILLGVESEGVHYMDYVAEFSTEKGKKILKEAIKKHESLNKAEEIIDRLKELREILDGYPKNIEEWSATQAMDAIKNVGEIRSSLTKLDEIPKNDDLIKKIGDTRKEYSGYIEKFGELLNAFKL